MKSFLAIFRFQSGFGSGGHFVWRDVCDINEHNKQLPLCLCIKRLVESESHVKLKVQAGRRTKVARYLEESLREAVCFGAKGD